MKRRKEAPRVFCSARNIGVLCVAAGFAWLLGSWIVLVIGAAALAGLVIRDVSVRRYPPAPPLPEASTFQSPEIRGAVDAIREARDERRRVLEGCGDDVLALLDGTLRKAGELEAAALRFARWGDELYVYLSTKDAGHVKRAVGAAQRSAEEAKTPGERRCYEAAAAAYETETQALRTIDLGLRGALAELESIQAALTALSPRIVTLRAASTPLAVTSAAHLQGDLLASMTDLEETETYVRSLSPAGDDALHDDGRSIVPIQRAPAPEAVAREMGLARWM